jgi:hypothetical protein
VRAIITYAVVTAIALLAAVFLPLPVWASMPLLAFGTLCGGALFIEVFRRVAERIGK